MNLMPYSPFAAWISALAKGVGGCFFLNKMVTAITRTLFLTFEFTSGPCVVVVVQTAGAVEPAAAVAAPVGAVVAAQTGAFADAVAEEPTAGQAGSAAGCQSG